MKIVGGDPGTSILLVFALLMLLPLTTLADRTAHFTRAPLGACELSIVYGVADYNGDGLNDLIGINAENGNGYSSDTLTGGLNGLYRWERKETFTYYLCTALGPGGNFSAGVALFVPRNRMTLYAFRDMNNDGFADLVVGVYLPLNASAGTSFDSSTPFSETSGYTSTTSFPDGTEVALFFLFQEWNRTARAWQTTYQINSETGPFCFIQETVDTTYNEAPMMATAFYDVWRFTGADFLNDGHIGMISASYCPSNGNVSETYYAVVYPSRNFSIVCSAEPVSNAQDTFAALDVDNDGWLDILWLIAPYRFYWIRNEGGRGNFSASTILWPPSGYDYVSSANARLFGDGWETLVVGDFNGDGLADVGMSLAPSTYTPNFPLFGDLVVFPHLRSEPWFSIDVFNVTFGCPVRPYAVGDVTGDGLVDILGMTGLWLANNGSAPGHFICQGLESVEHPYVMSVVDYNSDGLLDAMGRHSLINNGPCPAGTAGQITKAPRLSLIADGDKWRTSYTEFHSCAPCTAGVAPNPDSLTCGRCPPGFFPLRTDSCRPCGSGQFSSEGLVCEKCDADHHSVVGSRNCTRCAPGSIPDSQSAYCVLCGAGTYYDNSSLPSRCLPCPGVAQFSLPGSLACSDCPAGQVPTADKRSCFTCAIGQGFLNGQCVPCPAGSAAINGSCQTCGRGKAPNDAQNDCVQCPAGTISTNTTCESCGPTASSRPGSVTCTPCDPGYGPNYDRSGCAECPAGSYSDSGVCVSCPLDTQSTMPGATTCQVCTGCGLAAAIILPAAITTPNQSRFQNPIPPLGDSRYVDKIQSALLYVALAAFLVCGIGSIVLNIYLRKQKHMPTKGCVAQLARLDIFFATSHRVAMVPGPVMKRRTIGGAFLTIAVIFVFIFLIAGLGLRYARDNVTLAEAQLPSQALDALPPVDLSAVVTLYGYGGPCNNIHASADGMGPVTSAVGRDSSSLACAVAMTCTQCSFTTSTPALTIDYAEPSAYAQSLGWNVSAATASVAGANWVAGTLSGGGAHVIQGVDPPSQLRISAYYQQTSGGGGGSDGAKDDVARDEYVLGMVGVTLGATANETTFAPLSSPGIRVTITLQREAFYVQRLLTARQSFAEFATGVFGAISGILVVAKFLLAVAEELRVTCLPTDAERAAQASGQGGGREGSESVLGGSSGAEMFPLPESSRS